MGMLKPVPLSAARCGLTQTVKLTAMVKAAG